MDFSPFSSLHFSPMDAPTMDLPIYEAVIVPANGQDSTGYHTRFLTYRRTQPTPITAAPPPRLQRKPAQAHLRPAPATRHTHRSSTDTPRVPGAWYASPDDPRPTPSPRLPPQQPQPHPRPYQHPHPQQRRSQPALAHHPLPQPPPQQRRSEPLLAQYHHPQPQPRRSEPALRQPTPLILSPLIWDDNTHPDSLPHFPLPPHYRPKVAHHVRMPVAGAFDPPELDSGSDAESEYEDWLAQMPGGWPRKRQRQRAPVWGVFEWTVLESDPAPVRVEVVEEVVVVKRGRMRRFWRRVGKVARAFCLR